tara:strand:- start:428 stop:1543 length:1116 start_codon:yes stop_codon:yes gene_type:complete
MTDEEPPDIQKIGHNDTRGILLKPNTKIGEIGVLNCSIAQLNTSWPKPILIRTRMTNNGNEYSKINLAYLHNPTSITPPKPLITPTEKYELNGCEDPHILTEGDINYITYVAASNPNAQIALATASKDFSQITKQGIISPNISLEEAISIVPSRRYKRRWKKRLKEINNQKQKTGLDIEAKLYVKDGLLHKEGDIWYFIYRIEPDAQIAMVTNLDDLHDDNFWRKEIKTLEDRTFMKARKGQLKVGIGALYDYNGKHLGLHHKVSGKNTTPFKLKYKGSLFQGNFHENEFNLESRLRNPLLVPTSKDSVLIEGKNKKSINFLTAATIDPKDPDKLFLYYGIGDKLIGWRTTSLGWVMGELNHPHNREEYIN